MDSNSQLKFIVAFNAGPETNESDLGDGLSRQFEDLIAAMISCTPRTSAPSAFRLLFNTALPLTS